MKFKGTLILLLIFAVVGAMAYYYDYKGGPQRESREKAAKGLLTLDKAKVKELRLHYPDKEIVGVREKESQWKITAPIAAVGDGAEWERVVANLSDLEKEKVLAESPADLKPFGLDPPVLKVSVSTTDGKTFEAHFGIPNPTGSSVYAKLPNGKEVVLVPSTTYQGIKKDLLDLRDRSLLRFKEFDVYSLNLKNANGSYKLLNVNRNWEIKEPVTTKAEPAEVSALLNALSFTKVTEFIDYNVPTESEMGFDNPAIMVSLVEGKDGQGAGKVSDQAERPCELWVGAAKEIKGAHYYYAKDTARKDIMLIDQTVFTKLNRSLTELRSKELVFFHRYEVDGIDLKSEKESLSLRKDKTQWFLGTAPAARPMPAQESVPSAAEARPKVKSDQIVAMLNALESFKVTEFVDRPGALGTYGLEKPRVEVVLWKGEDRLAQVHFGRAAKPSMKQAEDQRFCYMNVTGEAYVKIVNLEVMSPFNVSRSEIIETEVKP
ncbi:MAG: DUF4340 domain-containing protein [Acidobacteria bacterium]|nr:DUF4340 domain-containing protein [Acidobacteriota bacterium]MBI3654876.1 DUF4340 domain-containing protein [Acidobacteriota bacterium]